jgi:hypothetical protein
VPFLHLGQWKYNQNWHRRWVFAIKTQKPVFPSLHHDDGWDFQHGHKPLVRIILAVRRTPVVVLSCFIGAIN